jgi:hypothetical protein
MKFRFKKLNFLKKRRKSSGTKRKIIGSIALALSLAFGGLKIVSAKIQNHKTITTLAH